MELNGSTTWGRNKEEKERTDRVVVDDQSEVGMWRKELGRRRRRATFCFPLWVQTATLNRSSW